MLSKLVDYYRRTNTLQWQPTEPDAAARRNP
jgi:hypothetical protein